MKTDRQILTLTFRTVNHSAVNPPGLCRKARTLRRVFLLISGASFQCRAHQALATRILARMNHVPGEAQERSPMPLRIKLTAETPQTTDLADVARFLDAFATLYEAAQVFSNRRYSDIRERWGADRRAELAAEDRLYIETLRSGSLTLTAVGAWASGTIIAALTVTNLLQKLLDWKIDRQLKEQQLIKLTRENRQAIEADTRAATERLIQLTAPGAQPTPASSRDCEMCECNPWFKSSAEANRN